MLPDKLVESIALENSNIKGTLQERMEKFNKIDDFFSKSRRIIN